MKVKTTQWFNKKKKREMDRWERLWIKYLKLTSVKKSLS